MRLIVNGASHDVTSDPSRPLLSVLRDELSLRGAKPACGEGVCGACTVLVGGAPTRACVTAVGDVAGRPVTTIEGLAQAGASSLVQRALLAERAFQCGYCTPGLALAITALVEQDRDPDDFAVGAALDGNVCRCGVYPRIRRAVERLRQSSVAHIATDEQFQESPDWQPLPEPRDAPWDRQPLDERDYFRPLGDGLVVVVPPPEEGSAWTDAWSTSGGAWLHVGSDGAVTAFTGKVEMGQNNQAALTSIVSAAMAAQSGAVRIVMADTDLCPYDEGTFGSRSVADAGAMLQGAAWTAIDTLARMAAERFEANPDDLVARNGSVESRDGARRIRYGDLLQGVRRLETVTGRPHRPRALAVAAPPERPTDSGLAIVTGRRTFATDIHLPGMLEGRQLAPPVVGGRLASVDLAVLHGQPDVAVVHDGDFVAVAAADVAAADRASEAIRAAWHVDTTQSSADLIEYLRSHPVDDADADDAYDYEAGDVDAALEHGSVLRQTYTTAFVAHVPLESRVAVAAWTGDRVTVWTATQAPFWARQELAEQLGIDEDRVRVIVPPLGGAFGGKHAAGPGIAAARLARATGRPVRVRWRHPDEFAWGHVRPAAVIDVAAAVSADLSILAWDIRNLNGDASAIRPPYRIANQRLRYRPCQSPLPQSSYRALGATANTFARESMIDELARLAGANPLEFRLANVDDERLGDALTIAAERAGWPGNGRGADGHGFGIAGSVEKDARVATCAEVSVDREGRVTIVRITTAFDCGAIVDADNLTNQVEGATVMALGPALFEAVEFERGRITTASLATYRVPRYGETPGIDIVLIDQPDIPSAGAGEVPLIAVAPAISNAIHAATGTRLRSLPLIPEGVVTPAATH